MIIKINEKGFTLIETIIYVAILALVVGAFISFSLSITYSRNKAYVVQEVQSNSRLAVDIMSQKIRAATGLNVGASTFDSDPGVLSLSMSDGSQNPTIFSLDQDNGRLQIQEGLNSPVYLTSDEVKVTNLTFEKLSPRRRENIGINMTIEFNAASSSMEYEYSQDIQTSVNIRQ